jgi:hypothetical protein
VRSKPGPRKKKPDGPANGKVYTPGQTIELEL